MPTSEMRWPFLIRPPAIIRAVRGGAKGANRLAAALAAGCLWLLADVTDSHARKPKTVFHGMPTEAEEAKAAQGTADPIVFSALWTYDGFASPLSGEAAGSTSLVAASDRDGEVVGLEPGSGREVWRAKVEGPLPTGPVLSEGLLLQTGGDGLLVALDPADGREIWRAGIGGPAAAPPVRAGGRLLVATSTPELVVVDPSSGAVQNRLPLPGQPVAPTVSAGVAILGTDHGMVLAVDVVSFEVLWRRYMKQAVTAPPLVHNGRVYVGVADRSVRCLRLSSGRELWRQRTGSIMTARLLAQDDFVYALCYDNDIYVLRARSGHLRSRIRLDHRLSQDAAVTGEHLFLTPLTEATLVGLAFPALGVAGRFHLDSPGEWFTTAPVALAEDRLAVGYGHTAGRLMAVSFAKAPPPEKEPGAKGSPDKGSPQKAPQEKGLD